MTIQLGQVAPDFEQETTEGRIRFHEWLDGHWGILVSHPKDFTPVCTTELGEAARLKPEFDRRGVKVIGLYGMIHPEADPALTVRTVYVIDPQRKVRMMLAYPPSAGRNFDEILRVIDSLQLIDRHKLSTPVNWQPGQRAIIVPSVSDEDAARLFPQGWKAKTPYLRLVDVPQE